MTMLAPSIRVFDMDFNLLAEIDDYESLQLTRRFFKAGEFELHIALGKQSTDQLLKYRIICIDNKSNKAGYIMSREVATENGVETLIVKGPTLEGILNRRVTLTSGYDRIRGKAETVMKHYVHNNLGLGNGNPIDRVVPFFAVADDLGRGIETPWQTRFEALDVVMQEIAEWCDMGWLVSLDLASKRWVFDVLPGRNLTTSQNMLPPVIFSHDFDNIESQSFVDSDFGYKNVGYAGGQGEDEDRQIMAIGQASGFNRTEVFMDISSAEDLVELSEMGEQQLAAAKRIVSFDGKVLDTNSFKYEVDWDLGDVVTLQNKRWGLTMDSRITEVKEIYEPNSKLEVRFGNDLPTITNAVKSLQNQVKRSG